MAIVVSAVFTMGGKLRVAANRSFRERGRGMDRLRPDSIIQHRIFGDLNTSTKTGHTRCPGTDLTGSCVSAMARSTFSLVSQSLPLLLRFTRMGESAS